MLGTAQSPFLASGAQRHGTKAMRHPAPKDDCLLDSKPTTSCAAWPSLRIAILQGSAVVQSIRGTHRRLCQILPEIALLNSNYTSCQEATEEQHQGGPVPMSMSTFEVGLLFPEVLAGRKCSKSSPTDDCLVQISILSSCWPTPILLRAGATKAEVCTGAVHRPAARGPHVL